MRPFWRVLLVGFAILFTLGAAVVGAEEHERLTPLLGDLGGWQATPAVGRSLVSARMKIITAHRVYSSGAKGLVLDLLVNSGPALATDLQEANSESDVTRMRVSKMKGFWVKTTHDKKNNSGQVIVYLAYNQESNSKLLASYTDLSEEDALAVLQKLNWTAMETVVASML